MDIQVAKHRAQVRGQILGCRKCTLRGACKAPVPFRGPTPALVALVGEAPGRDEDNQGKPFIGASGQLLMDLVCGQLQLTEDELFICNTVSCRPPANRKPYSKEVDMCSMNLAAQLALAQPKYVVLLGATALSAFLPTRQISKIHGRPFKMGTRKYLPTYHPAAAIYDKSLTRDIETDLTRLYFMMIEDNQHPRPEDDMARATKTVVDVFGIKDGNPWPDDCEECGQPVDAYDEKGIAWCRFHDPSKPPMSDQKMKKQLQAEKKLQKKMSKYVPLKG